MGPLLIENDKKMIKRDWKLPNPSYFTSKSIVQPFYKPTTHFTQFLPDFHDDASFFRMTQDDAPPQPGHRVVLVEVVST